MAPRWHVKCNKTLDFLNTLDTPTANRVKTFPKVLCYIWAQILRQGIYLVPAQIKAWIINFYFHPNICRRLHLVYLEIGDKKRCSLSTSLPRNLWHPIFLLYISVKPISVYNKRVADSLLLNFVGQSFSEKNIFIDLSSVIRHFFLIRF